MRAKNEAGQSLVELAFLLPAFCFSVLAIVQLIVFCRNQLEMQRMAQVGSEQVTSTTTAGKVLYSRFNRLWGRTIPPYMTRTREPFTTWQGYKGISTISEQPGRLMKIKIATQLLPGLGFTYVLGITEQHSTALALVEPPLPKGQD